MYKRYLLIFLVLNTTLSSCVGLCNGGEGGDGVADGLGKTFRGEIPEEIRSDEEAKKAGSEFQLRLREIADKILPSVVKIETVQAVSGGRGGGFFGYDFFKFFENNPLIPPKRGEDGQDEGAKTLGSGFVINEDGHVITNAHVVGDALKIVVVVGDNEYRGEVVGRDLPSDLTVLKLLDYRRGSLPYLSLNEEVEIEVGDFAMAVGNPFGLIGSFTIGVVSAKGRRSLGTDRNAIFKNFIQTDASINQGNSGGPLVNIEGKVIGINTAIYTSNGGLGSVGIGFAIPVNIARRISQTLIKSGKVVRGYIGVSIRDLDKDLSQHFNLSSGVLVLELLPGGAGEGSGLKRGDIITHINGKEIKRTVDMIGEVSGYPPDTLIELSVVRGDKRLEIGIKLKERPTELAFRDGFDRRGIERGGDKSLPKGKRGTRGSGHVDKWYGLTLSERKLPLGRGGENEDNEGKEVYVYDKSVYGGVKWSQSIERGDVIESINGKELSGGLESFRKVIREEGGKASYFVWIRRGSNRFYTLLRVKKE